ncbi:MAG: primosomal protein N' [Candidatus Cryptobacteroides sp.]
MRYILVLLPLKLEWELCYWTEEEGLSIGDRVTVEVSGKEIEGIVSETDVEPQTAPSKIHQVKEWLKDEGRVDKSLLRFWKSLAEYYMCTGGEVLKAALPALKASSPQTGGRLPAKARNRKQTAQGPGNGGMPLTPAQREAKEKIEEAFSRHKPVLLNGVTGSGKTGIYISLASKVLAKGKNVLYLVPEIALTRQLEQRLGEAFGDRLAVYHSGQTPARRSAATGKVLEGNYIVLGTRSALFMPHRNLGLVIVDEEHDSSYKQDAPAPRYNGRDAAFILAGTAVERCDILLGSATPSLESMYNCLCGKYVQVSLNERYHSGGGTDVLVVDTKAERRKRGMRGDLSLKLIERLQTVLDSGGQALIVRARRSYSPVLQCESCGDIPKCPVCGGVLSHHKDKASLCCHRCGFSKKAAISENGDIVCSLCGGVLKGIGSGTQKIEEEMREVFPQARIARLDGDTAQSAKFSTEVLKQFSKGEIDIIVGTQIITKGFDFSNVRLVAAIHADSLAGNGGFRSDEKAFQVLSQLRGRCARRDSRGIFVIQTAQPEHPVFRMLSCPQSDTPQAQEALYSELLAERQEFGYPPYVRLVDITVSDSNPDRASEMADRLKEKICRLQGGFSVKGPYTLDYQDNDKYVLRIAFPKDKNLSNSKRLVRDAVIIFEEAERYQGHITIDADPS